MLFTACTRWYKMVQVFFKEREVGKTDIFSRSAIHPVFSEKKSLILGIQPIHPVMQITREKDHLIQCKTLIEEKLGWGTSENWENQDFLALSDKILEATGVQLSGTTLKRIWGKVKYDSIPHTNTLNTLAHFLDYENWLAFKAAHTTETPAQSSAVPHGREKKPQNALFLKIAAIAGILILAITIISSINRSEHPPLPQEAIEKAIFTSNPVTQGIPNTVVFHYDVSHLSGDTFRIQQTWDARKQFDIDPTRHEATSIYYYPGYWRAKLLVDGQVIKQHNLHIQSEGWMATIEREPRPRYLLNDELIKEDRLTISTSVAKEINAAAQGPEVLSYHLVRKFAGIDGDNLTYEVAVKNTYQKGDGVCQFTNLLLLGTKGAIIIPLVAPGCTSEIGLMFNDVYKNGKTNDLSAFGTDFSTWQKVRLVNKGQHASIYLNDQLIHQLNYDAPIGELSGLRFRFLGSGEVQYVKLWNQGGELAFEESFAISSKR